MTSAKIQKMLPVNQNGISSKLYLSNFKGAYWSRLEVNDVSRTVESRTKLALLPENSGREILNIQSNFCI